MPSFPRVAAPHADDGSPSLAFSLAGIALLLVVIAGGSLLRLTAMLPGNLQRGRPA